MTYFKKHKVLGILLMVGYMVMICVDVFKLSIDSFMVIILSAFLCVGGLVYWIGYFFELSEQKKSDK